MRVSAKPVMQGKYTALKACIKEKKIPHESVFLIQIKIKEEQWKYITSRKKGKIKAEFSNIKNRKTYR